MFRALADKSSRSNGCFCLASLLVRILSPSRNKKPLKKRLFTGRDYRIRTYDILLPKQALYQAELSPEYSNNNTSVYGSKMSRHLVLLRKFCARRKTNSVSGKQTVILLFSLLLIRSITVSILKPKNLSTGNFFVFQPKASALPG